MTAKLSLITKYFHPSTYPFHLVHVAALSAFWVAPTQAALWTLLATYLVRMFAITGGYHRYFSHKSYKTSRAFQFFLAFLGGTSAQKGALWWAAHHRHHHRYSDEEEDLHSPTLRGFWWSHVGWILSPRYEKIEAHLIPDLMKYPELRFLAKHHWLPPTILGATLFLVGGWSVFVWGFLVSTVLLWHATFTINSLSHVFGSRRFKTTDTSRNNFWLALLTLGEGWHNNHHHYMLSTRQGFYWWEIDISYYVLKGLSFFGIVWDLKAVPREILAGSSEPVAEDKVQAKPATLVEAVPRLGAAASIKMNKISP